MKTKQNTFTKTKYVLFKKKNEKCELSPYFTRSELNI